MSSRKNRESLVLRVSERLAVLLDLQVLHDDGDVQKWFTGKHRQEMLQLIIDAVQKRCKSHEIYKAQSCKTDGEKKAAHDKTVTGFQRGDTLKVGYKFSKRSVNLGCLLPNKSILCPSDESRYSGGGYQPLRLFPEKLNVYVCEYDPSRGQEIQVMLNNALESSDQVKTSISDYFQASSGSTKQSTLQTESAVKKKGRLKRMMQNSSKPKPATTTKSTTGSSAGGFFTEDSRLSNHPTTPTKTSSKSPKKFIIPKTTFSITSSKSPKKFISEDGSHPSHTSKSNTHSEQENGVIDKCNQDSNGANVKSKIAFDTVDQDSNDRSAVDDDAKEENVCDVNNGKACDKMDQGMGDSPVDYARGEDVCDGNILATKEPIYVNDSDSSSDESTGSHVFDKIDVRAEDSPPNLAQKKLESHKPKNDQVESYNFKNGQSESNKSKNDQVESYKSKNGQVESNKSKNNQVEIYKSKNGQVESYKSKNGQAKSYKSKNRQAESYKSKKGQMESYESKNSQVESNKSKNGQLESYKFKNDHVDVRARTSPPNLTQKKPESFKSTDSQRVEKIDLRAEHSLYNLTQKTLERFRATNGQVIKTSDSIGQKSPSNFTHRPAEDLSRITKSSEENLANLTKGAEAGLSRLTKRTVKSPTNLINGSVKGLSKVSKSSEKSPTNSTEGSEKGLARLTERTEKSPTNSTKGPEKGRSRTKNSDKNLANLIQGAEEGLSRLTKIAKTSPSSDSTLKKPKRKRNSPTREDGCIESEFGPRTKLKSLDKQLDDCHAHKKSKQAKLSPQRDTNNCDTKTGHKALGLDKQHDDCHAQTKSSTISKQGKLSPQKDSINCDTKTGHKALDLDKQHNDYHAQKKSSTVSKQGKLSPQKDSINCDTKTCHKTKLKASHRQVDKSPGTEVSEVDDCHVQKPTHISKQGKSASQTITVNQNQKTRYKNQSKASSGQTNQGLDPNDNASDDCRAQRKSSSLPKQGKSASQRNALSCESKSGSRTKLKTSHKKDDKSSDIEDNEIDECQACHTKKSNKVRTGQMTKLKASHRQGNASSDSEDDSVVDCAACLARKLINMSKRGKLASKKDSINSEPKTGSGTKLKDSCRVNDKSSDADNDVSEESHAQKKSSHSRKFNNQDVTAREERAFSDLTKKVLKKKQCSPTHRTELNSDHRTKLKTSDRQTDEDNGHHGNKKSSDNDEDDEFHEQKKSSHSRKFNNQDVTAREETAFSDLTKKVLKKKRCSPTHRTELNSDHRTKLKTSDKVDDKSHLVQKRKTKKIFERQTGEEDGHHGNKKSKYFEKQTELIAMDKVDGEVSNHGNHNKQKKSAHSGKHGRRNKDVERITTDIRPNCSDKRFNRNVDIKYNSVKNGGNICEANLDRNLDAKYNSAKNGGKICEEIVDRNLDAKSNSAENQDKTGEEVISDNKLEEMCDKFDADGNFNDQHEDFNEFWNRGQEDKTQQADKDENRLQTMNKSGDSGQNSSKDSQGTEDHQENISDDDEMPEMEIVEERSSYSFKSFDTRYRPSKSAETVPQRKVRKTNSDRTSSLVQSTLESCVKPKSTELEPQIPKPSASRMNRINKLRLKSNIARKKRPWCNEDDSEDENCDSNSRSNDNSEISAPKIQKMHHDASDEMRPVRQNGKHVGKEQNRNHSDQRLKVTMGIDESCLIRTKDRHMTGQSSKSNKGQSSKSTKEKTFAVPAPISIDEPHSSSAKNKHTKVSRLPHDQGSKDHSGQRSSEAKENTKPGSSAVSSSGDSDVVDLCSDEEEEQDDFQRNSSLIDVIGDKRDVRNLNDGDIEYLMKRNKQYFKSIFAGKIPCKRHQDYKAGGYLRGDLNHSVRFGPFTDENQDTIVKALIHVFCKKNSHWEKLIHVNKESHWLLMKLCPSNMGQLMDIAVTASNKYFDYVSKVLLPEALAKICMDVHGITHPEAVKFLAETQSASFCM